VRVAHFRECCDSTANEYALSDEAAQKWVGDADEGSVRQTAVKGAKGGRKGQQ
jgi:hypothetical protein